MIMPTSLSHGADYSRMANTKDLKDSQLSQREKLGQQFEGLLISQLIKEMRQSSGFGEGLFPGDDSDTFGAIFDQYLSDHLTANGGIGLAEFIQAGVEKQSNS